MKTNSIAEQLLNGSRQINVWREEIDTLVKILLSLIRECNLTSQHDIFCNEEKTTVWQIRTNRVHPTEIVLIAHPCPGDGESCVYSSDGAFVLPGKRVQAVRETLDTLVGGLLSIFPALNDKWKFLIDATPLKSQG